ncbi:family 43 glycosylhydrolase [Deinococcus apachensis]|uniref:family 43 glycosylhydrolase n=1 Tax=Deinococcus apachensis TaxID=309886 RepID=UPI00038018D8|nr:family 43 glycosylhydrolase [Deinococcus apachensis]
MKRVPIAPVLLTAAWLTALAVFQAVNAGGGLTRRTYTNPLDIPGPQPVVACGDPSILRSRIPGDAHWYAYCTSDPHDDTENNGAGAYPLHPITILRSADLTRWELVGDALPIQPEWVAPDGLFWAPDAVAWPDGTYRLYYAASRTDAGGSAIGVATSRSPAGPWVDSGRPVVEAQGELAVLDPDVIQDARGQSHVYYGSSESGIWVRQLSRDGLRSDPRTQVCVAAPSGPAGFGTPEVVRRGGFYYLMASSSPCCLGPLTGNGIFVGRSPSPTGPFLDREGRDLNSAWTGGTPVLMMNGNCWVGPGSGSVVADAAGRDWLFYHAIDRHDPYFQGQTQINKRHLMLDPVDWVGGWPTVRHGRGPSEGTQPAPALRANDPKPPAVGAVPAERLGPAFPELSDEFNGTRLGPQWRWLRSPSGTRVTGGAFHLTTVAGDLRDGTAPALLERAPTGNYVVETKMTFPLPEGTAPGEVEAGLVVYGDDRNFLRLTVGALGVVRISSFIKASEETGSVRAGYGVVGTPAPTTWLRIVKRTVGSEERYTPFTSTDDRVWERGGTYTHQLGRKAQLGLVALSHAGYQARFDYLRVFRLTP